MGAVIEDNLSPSLSEQLALAGALITAERLADGAVSSDKLAPGSVVAAHLADGSITSEKMENGSVGTDQLAAGSVNAEKIAARSIIISSRSLLSYHIGEKTITSGHLQPLSVTEGHLVDGSVSSEKLSIEVQQLLNNLQPLQTAQLPTDVSADSRQRDERTLGGRKRKWSEARARQATSEHLVDGSVSGAKLEQGSVTSEHLADGSVSGAKLEQGSVTSEHLVDGSVSGAKLAFLPVAAQLPGVTMAFGSERYVFQGAMESLRITVLLTPYTDDSYVLVAMSDHPCCSCFLVRKQAHEAELEVVRTRLGPEPQGWIQWIAVIKVNE